MTVSRCSKLRDEPLHTSDNELMPMPLTLFPRYQVLALAGPPPFPDPQDPGAGVIPVMLDTGVAPKRWYLRRRVFAELAEHGAIPTQAATDFYRVAAAVYTADLRVPRKSGFDGWARDIVLHLPVSDLAIWNEAATALRDLLTFLTGDHWTLRLYQVHAPPPVPVPQRRSGRAEPTGTPSADAVCLLSGGLDSCIGAIDALAAGRSLALASHNAKGSDAFSSRAQMRVVHHLAREYGSERVSHFRFRVDPPPADGRMSAAETSTRSRSIMFIALGLLVASALPEGTPLIVPENGFISLNVPLTPARLGSWSTRTTHPHTMILLRRVLDKVGIRTLIETPYQFLTKGEMLEGSANTRLLQETVGATISCAHPSNSRFEPEGRRQPHCGYCVPCIIRRAALYRVRWDNPRAYRYNVITERDSPLLAGERGEDVRAMLIALARRRVQPSRVSDLLRAGPLPASDQTTLAAYLRVYDEGMSEVERLLLENR